MPSSPAEFPRTAFILGAGLGTRLRPLTEVLPKPLIPVGQAPLVEHAFTHAAGAGVKRFVVNTHHLAERYAEHFPDHRAAGAQSPIRFVHEPEVLETAGGLWNIGPVLDDLGEDGPVLVYNGDVLTTLPLQDLWSAHRSLGCEVTLALLPEGGPIQVNFDPESGLIRDFGQRLDPQAASNALFTGLYIVEPAFRRRLIPGRKESVVHVWLRMIQEGASVGGVFLEGGQWRDLGRREEYLRVIAELHAAQSALPGSPRRQSWGGLATQTLVHQDTVLAPGARLVGACQVGAGARIGEGAVVEDSILWPGAEIAANARLRHCIVTGRGLISGEHSGEDL